MKIVTKQFEIRKIDDLKSSYIENCLMQMGIEPLRWAIVDVNEDSYILSVSYETD